MIVRIHFCAVFKFAHKKFAGTRGMCRQFLILLNFHKGIYHLFQGQLYLFLPFQEYRMQITL